MSTQHMTLREACKALGMSKRTVFTRAGHDRTFPIMIRVPNKGVVFDGSEVEAWARANHATAAAPKGAY